MGQENLSVPTFLAGLVFDLGFFFAGDFYPLKSVVKR